MKTELKQENEEECEWKRYKTKAIMQRRKMGLEWKYKKLKKGEDEKL